MKITLYGASRCHKTQHYISFLDARGFQYTFLDVEENEDYAEQLRNLYTNRKLNFPTITINSKKLRNPSDADLLNWIEKLNEPSI